MAASTADDLFFYCVVIDDECYVFTFDQNRIPDLIDVCYRFANDPDLSFSHWDLKELVYRVESCLKD